MKNRTASVDTSFARNWIVSGADNISLRAYGWHSNTGRRPGLFWGHANGFSAGAYSPMLNQLARDFDIFAADLRAHGGSADPGGNYDRMITADRLAIDMISVIKSVREHSPLQPLHFAAHSMSGLAGLRMGAIFGLSPFRSMTLFEPPLVPTPDFTLHDEAVSVGHLLSVRATKRKQVLPSPEKFAEMLSERPGFCNWRPEMLKAFVNSTLEPKDDSDGFKLRCPAEAEAAGYRLTMDTSTFAALKRFNRPIVFVESDPSTQGPAPSWATMAQGVAAKQAPKGRLDRINGTSHMMPFENPEAVIKRIHESIASS
jgi:pimeloyl-ACP methyl ester carboxylesterase